MHSWSRLRMMIIFPWWFLSKVLRRLDNGLLRIRLKNSLLLIGILWIFSLSLSLQSFLMFWSLRISSDFFDSFDQSLFVQSFLSANFLNLSLCLTIFNILIRSTGFWWIWFSMYYPLIFLYFQTLQIPKFSLSLAKRSIEGWKRWNKFLRKSLYFFQPRECEQTLFCCFLNKGTLILQSL